MQRGGRSLNDGGRSFLEWWYVEAALKKHILIYVVMQRGVRFLYGDVASFSILSFNGAFAPYMMVCWSSFKKYILTYVAMQRGVRSLYGDVASFSRSSFHGAFAPWMMVC